LAVLRVDDRGVGRSTGSYGDATLEDFAGDALAGIEFIEGRKEIDPGKVGLIGHSEGAVIAPMVAARSKDIAFIVLPAGSGLRARGRRHPVFAGRPSSVGAIRSSHLPRALAAFS